jgi:hypothetical protein
METIESKLNNSMQIPFLQKIGDRIIIRDSRVRQPLHDLWTGLCVDSRGAFWYVGLVAEQRKMTKLDGVTFDEAQKQAHAIWLKDISSDLDSSLGSCHGELDLEPA